MELSARYCLLPEVNSNLFFQFLWQLQITWRYGRLLYMSLWSISKSISQTKISWEYGILHTLAWTRKMMKKVHELCETAVPYEQNTERIDLPLIVTFGDSTCIGVGATLPEKSLVGLIGATLPETTLLNRWTIWATMETTAEEIKKYKKDFPQRKVDRLFLILWGNDITDNLLSSKDGFSEKAKRRFFRLIEQAVSLCPDVVYITPGNIWATFWLTWVLWTQIFRSMLTTKSRVFDIIAHDVAEEKGIWISSNFREPHLDPIRTKRDLAASDGIHPSDLGYKMAFGRLQKILDTKNA